MIVGVRNMKKGESLMNRINKKMNKNVVEVLPLDMTSVISIKEFAEAFLNKGLPLHLLINNEGNWLVLIFFSLFRPIALFRVPYRRTSSGIERQFQANYLGPFLLTNLLLPKLTECSPSQIINVSSIFHRKGNCGKKFSETKICF